MQRAQLLRQLVLDAQYVVDEELVAAAVVARVATRGSVPEVAFRNDVRAQDRVRSFRPSNRARSFRPCNLQGSRDGLALSRTRLWS
jgi:hypothetical protein